MKRLICLVPILILFLPAVSSAQWADSCVVSGYIYWPDGFPADSVPVLIASADRDGGIFFNRARRYTTSPTGFVSFRVPRTRPGDTTFVGIKAPVSDWAVGRVAPVPDAETAIFSALTTTVPRYSIPVFIPHTLIGFNGTYMGVDTLLIAGSGASVAFSSWSKGTLTITAGASAYGDSIRKADSLARLALDTARAGHADAETALGQIATEQTTRGNADAALRDTSRFTVSGGCLSVNTTTPGAWIITIDSACIRAGLALIANVLPLDTANAAFIRGLVAAATFARIDSLAKLAGTLGYKIAIVNIDTAGFGARYMGVMTESDPTAIKADTASLAPIADQMYSRSGGASQWGTSIAPSLFPIAPSPFDSTYFKLGLRSGSTYLYMTGIPVIQNMHATTEALYLRPSNFYSTTLGLEMYQDAMTFRGKAGSSALVVETYRQKVGIGTNISAGSTDSSLVVGPSGNADGLEVRGGGLYVAQNIATPNDVSGRTISGTTLSAQGAGTVLKADSAIFKTVVKDTTTSVIVSDSLEYWMTEQELPKSFPNMATAIKRSGRVTIVVSSSYYTRYITLASDSANGVTIGSAKAELYASWEGASRGIALTYSTYNGNAPYYSFATGDAIGVTPYPVAVKAMTNQYRRTFYNTDSNTTSFCIVWTIQYYIPAANTSLFPIRVVNSPS